MEHFQFLIDQEPEVGQYAAEEWLRIKFQEFQKKETEWIREKLRDYVSTSISELEDFITWLEQCYEHHTIFIDEGLKFYVGRGYEIKTPYDECQERLVLEECEKFNTEYIAREIARLKDEYLIRDPKEELKHRINLSFF